MKSSVQSLRLLRLTAMVFWLVALCPCIVAGQQEEDPTTNAPMRVGPVFLTPTFSVTDIGVDSNVLNEDDVSQADFTATVNSGLEAAVRLGPTRLSGRTSSAFVYFQKLADQRFSERGFGGTFTVPLDRVRSSFTVDTLKTRRRPNNEIDLRAGRSVDTIDLAVDIPLTSRTEITASGQRQAIRFDEGETFRGVELSDTLDQNGKSVEFGVRFALTPMTTVNVGVEVRRDHFPRSPNRDANSVRFAPLFEFSPDALISGRASFGFRRFKTPDAQTPDYSGAVALVGVSYTLLGMTNFDVEYERDVRHSFEVSEPFYLSTLGRLEISQRIFGPFDLIARVMRERLDYRMIASAFADHRVDTVHAYGGGVGVRMGESAGLRITVEFSDRSSTTDRSQGYDRTRVFGSMDYGF